MKRALLLILTIVILLVAFSSCQITGCSYADLDYENSLRYQKGGASIDADVTQIEIEWIIGSVSIEYHDKNTIEFSEESNLEIDNKHTLRYYNDGNTLHIKYGKKGKFALGVGAIEKDLTIKLPRDFLLKELEIDSVSASILSNEPIRAENIDIESVSGGIAMAVDSVSEIELETVSGDVELNGNIKGASISSVSGDINISSSVLTQCEIETVSGAVTLSVEEESFTLTASTVSGTVACDFQTTTNDNTFVCGNGDNEYTIETVSGNIMLKKIIK